MNNGLEFCIEIGVNEGEIEEKKKNKGREMRNLGLYLGINKVLSD